ncbi:MAG TPA: hypothetical protein VGY55_12220 [Pirellulales bacterium]|nr:hypothetical protein [Pirellulales bacterium]
MTIPPTADRPTFKYAWHFPSLAFDSLVSLLLVISVMWVMEAWLRKPKRWQFSIRALGVWFAVVAVVLTILKQRSIVQKWIVDLGFAPGRPFEPHFESPGTDAWGWATIVAMLFGIGCFIWCFIHQTSRAASYLMRRLKPV